MHAVLARIRPVRAASPRALIAILLGSTLGLTLPRTAEAQWTDIWITPYGGSNYTVNQQVAVTVEFCATSGAWFDGPGAVFFNGLNAYFNVSTQYDPNCDEYQVATGTVILDAGVNTVTANIAGNGFWETEANYLVASYDPAQIDVTPHNGHYRNLGLCAVACFDVTAGYSLPAYVSMDVPRSTGVVYSSATVSSHHTVTADIRNTSSSSPAYYSIRLRKHGASSDQPFTNGATTMYVTNSGIWQRVAVQFADSTLPTGAHLYTLYVRSHWPGESRESSMPVRVLVVNERQSPYGAGWMVAGLQRLHEQTDGTVVITEGGGGIALFTPGCGTGGHTWCPPLSDFSTLTRHPSPAPDSARFTRRYPDGTVVTFNDAGLMRKVVDRFGQKPTYFTYQLLGGRWVVASIVDPVGKVTSFSYHAGGGGYLANSLHSITDPGGRTARMQVNTAGDLQQIWDVDSVLTISSAQYTAGDHRLEQLTDRGNGVWSYGYDHAHKLASVSSPYVVADSVSQRLVTTFMSPEKQLLVDPATSVGKTSSNLAPYHSRQTQGLVAAPTGEKTRYTLNRFGAPLQVTAPDGEVTNVTRNAQSQPTHAYRNNTAVATYTWVGVELREIYDPRTGERVYFEYEPTYHLLTRSHGSGPEVVYTYSGMGRLDAVKVGNGPTTTLSYLSSNYARPWKITDPEGHETKVEWSGNTWENTSLVTAGTSNIRKTSFTFDAYGRQQTVTLPDTTTFTTAYDLLNRDTSSTGPLGFAVRKRYGLIALDTLIDPIGNVYRWQRNAVGWVTHETDPLGATDTLAYNRRGQVTSWTNRRGQTTAFTYDSVGRIKSRTLADGRVTTYDYRPGSTYTWSWVVASNAESTDSIKTLADTTEEIAVRGGTTYRFKSVWSHADQRLTLTSPSGTHAEFRYGWDSMGRLTTITMPAISRHTLINHNLDGQRSVQTIARQMAAPFERAAGITTNPRSSHALASQTLNDATQQTYFGVTHVQDIRGQLIERLNGTRDQREVFGYDDLGRLTGYARYSVSPACAQTNPADEFGTPCVGGTQTLLENVSYTWDAVGNPTGAGITVSTGNRLAAFEGYAFAYDADGNMTRKYWAANPGTFDQYLYWNSAGELDSVRTIRNGAAADTVRFGYDGFGRRVRRAGWKSGSGYTVRYLYRGDHIVAELDAAGNVSASYSYYPGVDRPHSVTKPNGTHGYFIDDGSGNVAGMAAGNGDILQINTYAPFGERTSTWSWLSWELDGHLYSGREYDAETGLYFNRARYYDPEVRRFISSDPLGIGGGINPFVYAGNDPINLKDPSGLIPCTVEQEKSGMRNWINEKTGETLCGFVTTAPAPRGPNACPNCEPGGFEPTSPAQPPQSPSAPRLPTIPLPRLDCTPPPPGGRTVQNHSFQVAVGGRGFAFSVIHDIGRPWAIRSIFAGAAAGASMPIFTSTIGKTVGEGRTGANFRFTGAAASPTGAGGNLQFGVTYSPLAPDELAATGYMGGGVSSRLPGVGAAFALGITINMCDLQNL